MGVLLRIDGRDLSPYVRAQHEEGLEPYSEYSEPQFAGAAAFSEGLRFADDAVGNREWSVPLLLEADDRPSLHQLIEDLNGDLEVRGADVEFATDPADPITHFDLERGRLDVEYQYFLSIHAVARATLRLWTRPYGHAGTARLIASLRATAAVEFAATGVLGDVSAFAKLEVRVGSRVASAGRVVGYGLHRSASFRAIRGPSGTDFVAQSGATVRGASGAIGSQYLAIPVSPTGASGVALTSFLTPPGGHVGRFRALGVMRSGLDRAIDLHARDGFGARIGPTTAASQTDANKWGLVDLGEVSVPTRMPGQEPAPTQRVELIAGGASGAAVEASPALEVNRLIYLPLDESPGLMRTPGAAGRALLYSDAFDRLTSGDRLGNEPGADSGGAAWKGAATSWQGKTDLGALVIGDFGPVFVNSVLAPGGRVNSAELVKRPNASGAAALASGVHHQDVWVQVRTGLFYGASPAAASASIDLYAKAVTGTAAAAGPTLIASEGVWARWIFGPNMTLQLWKDPGGAATAIASAGMASVLASGIYQGKIHTLVLRVEGGRADVWAATGPLAASPILSASDADFARTGWPAVRMNAGSNVASAVIVADWLRYEALGEGASDIGPRERFRFESHPERRAYQGNASVFLADRAWDLRGEHPRVPPAGSPGASGPARGVVFSGDPDDFLGNDLLDVELRAVEAFKFLR